MEERAARWEPLNKAVFLVVWIGARGAEGGWRPFNRDIKWSGGRGEDGEQREHCVYEEFSC